MAQNRNNLDLEIILVLLKNKIHLRELSRNLSLPHATVLRKVNGLIKENILDCKKEGRNKLLFIKNNLQAKSYVYMAEKYKLTTLLKKYPELSIIFEGVLKRTEKNMVILFGSYAKGIAKKDSDIDVYVDTTDKTLKRALQETHSKLSIKIGKFDISDLLIKEIVKNHIVIKGVEEFYEKAKIFE